MPNPAKKKKKMSLRELRKLRKNISSTIPRNYKGAFIPKASAVEQEFTTPLVTQQTSDNISGRFLTTLLPVDLIPPEHPEYDENTFEPLIIEKEKEDDNFHPVSGRRVVDINYLLQELQNKGRHNGLFDCQSNFKLIGERRVGLLSQFKFKCDFCHEIVLIWSENVTEPDNLNVNLAATSGIIASGIGFSQFEELFSAMNIPVFATKYHAQLQNQVYEKWELTAVESMEAAAQKEKEIAITEGRIKNGIPIIDVYVDGSWCARSYGTNYKASSGAAAIIGRKTGEVLYIGIKNKYCLICARAENKKTVPKEHQCFKNFEGSSSSMEAEIIAEGFKSSIAMYSIIYGRLIADGDASTYSKILNSKPYETEGVTVEKIECRNHILRNFCKKMRALPKETKYPLVHRKTLTDKKIMTIRKAIVKSIKHHKSSETTKDMAISLLHNDINNSVSHAYGDHRMCYDYNCSSDISSIETNPIKNSTFLFRINAIVSSVASKSRSLVEDVDTNIVECFNNVIAKFIGGKRINFSVRRGYQGRCSAAVVSFNTHNALSSVQKSLINKNPSGRVIEIEKRRANKRKVNLDHPVKKRRKFREIPTRQNDYGPNSSTPDMDENEYTKKKEEFFKNLKELTADREKIERSTILQRDCSDWLEIRKNLITASNFGSVCKRQISRDTAPLVKSILYQKNLAHITSIAHGIEHEQQALQQIQQQEHLEIEPCGLYIDKKYPFIGATPDGIIGEEELVEVKCPITASKNGFKKALKDNKIQILKYNKKTNIITINKKSNWFYQIQGQLHVTGRRVCLLGIWSGDNEPVHIERIERDDEFWATQMEPKLLKFYMKCMLPEILDPRQTRGMPLRKITFIDEKENVQPVSIQTNT